MDFSMARKTYSKSIRHVVSKLFVFREWLYVMCVQFSTPLHAYLTGVIVSLINSIAPILITRDLSRLFVFGGHATFPQLVVFSRVPLRKTLARAKLFPSGIGELFPAISAMRSLAVCAFMRMAAFVGAKFRSLIPPRPRARIGLSTKKTGVSFVLSLRIAFASDMVSPAFARTESNFAAFSLHLVDFGLNSMEYLSAIFANSFYLLFFGSGITGVRAVFPGFSALKFTSTKFTNKSNHRKILPNRTTRKPDKWGACFRDHACQSLIRRLQPQINYSTIVQGEYR